MYKAKVFLNTLVYTWMEIFQNSKLLMYDFYNHLKKKYRPRCQLLYTDTNSLLLEIETDVVYDDMVAYSHIYDG